MSTVSLPEEGDSLSASSINDRFTELAACFNDLADSDLNLWCFHHQHLPSRATGRGFFDVYSAVSDPAAPTAGELYENTLPDGVGIGGVEASLELFHPQVYGPYTAPGFGGPHTADEGWLIPSRTAGSAANNAMQVTMTSRTDFSSLQGVRVTGWVELRESRELPDSDPDSGASSANRGEAVIYVGIGLEDSAGTRHVLNRTVRRFSSQAYLYGPLTVKDMVRNADINLGTLNGNIDKIFVAVMSGIWDAAKNQHGACSPYIRNYALVVEPLQGGVLA